MSDVTTPDERREWEQWITTGGNVNPYQALRLIRHLDASEAENARLQEIIDLQEYGYSIQEPATGCGGYYGQDRFGQIIEGSRKDKKRETWDAIRAHVKESQ